MEKNRQAAHRAMFLSCKYLERFEEICDFADSLSWDQEYMRDKLYCFLTLEAVDKTGNFGCLTRNFQPNCWQMAGFRTVYESPAAGVRQHRLGETVSDPESNGADRGARSHIFWF